MNKCYFILFLIPLIISGQSSKKAINQYRSDFQLQQSIIKGMKNSMGNLNKNFISNKSIFTIAFGSCSSEESDLPIFKNIVKFNANISWASMHTRFSGIAIIRKCKRSTKC